MANSTPGPWEVRDEPMANRGNVVVRAVLPDGRTPKLATVIAPSQHAVRERDANAKLIAAAPALADALEKRGTHDLNCPSTREIGRMGSRSGLYWNRATDAATCKCELGAALRAAGRLP